MPKEQAAAISGHRALCCSSELRQVGQAEEGSYVHERSFEQQVTSSPAGSEPNGTWCGILAKCFGGGPGGGGASMNLDAADSKAGGGRWHGGAGQSNHPDPGKDAWQVWLKGTQGRGG